MRLDENRSAYIGPRAPGIVRAVRAATVVVTVMVAVAPVVAVVPPVAMAHLQTAATSLPALAPIPLSAFARLTRPLQQRTVKENKYAATCSPQVP